MDSLKLRTYDGIVLAGFLMLPSLFSTELSRLAEQNNTAGWIAVLIAFAVMLCLFLVAVLLTRRHQGHIIDITSAVMGKPFGLLYGFILGAYFCFFTGIHIREGAELLKIYGLRLTPVYVVVGLILLTAVIMNFLGGRTIVKSAGFFFIIVLLGVVFAILLGLNNYNPDNLVPVLGAGLPDIAINGLYMTSLFDGVIVLLLFAPAFSSPAKLRSSGVLSLCLTAAAYVLLFVCFVMAFSPAVSSKMTSGYIEMGKSSYFNHFFYRFESILLFFLIFSYAMLASIGLFAARESFARVFRQKKLKPVTLFCAITVLIACFFPANVIELTQVYLPVIRRYSIFFMAGAPLLVLIISTIKRIFKYEKA